MRQTPPSPQFAVRSPRRPRRALLGAALGLAALAAACGGRKADTEQPGDAPRGARPVGHGPAGLPRRGGVLRHRIANDYVNLDPHATAQASAQWVGMLA